MSETKKKVLIISYYWPPAGGGGVQRWLKFARYLPSFNWSPIVYTPENPDYPILDHSLIREVPADIEVLQHPIFEPYRWYRNLVGKKNKGLSAGFIRDQKEESFGSKCIGWIRGNIILPDARRFWIRPSIQFLSSYLEEHPVDAIITTGPPHSMHLIGLGLKKRTGIPWIADFRDPWVNMDHADKLRVGKAAMNRHRAWERKVVRSADQVITASWHVAHQYEALRGKPVHVITNGFDPADFPHEVNESHEWCIGHFGTMGDDRNPIHLWEAISEIRRETGFAGKNVKLVFAGPTDAEIHASLERAGLNDILTFSPYLSHEESVQKMMQCKLLLLPLNRNSSEEGRVPGKIFEYLATGNYILGIGSPTGDSSRILRETKAGIMLSYDDKEGMRKVLADALNGTLDVKGVPHGVDQFSRRNLTLQLVNLLDRLE